MTANTNHPLISELLAAPAAFNDRGRAYNLLQAYFDGLPTETLRPLLRSRDPLVQRAAVFIASELGARASDLIDAVVPLLTSGDRYLEYHAMEVLAVCCTAGDGRAFFRVVLQLESPDEVLRGLAMRLLCRADVSQLEAARRAVSDADSQRETHRHGLALITSRDYMDLGALASLLTDPNPLLRKYAAIAVRRGHPSLMTSLAASEDDDLKRFHSDSRGLPA